MLHILQDEQQNDPKLSEERLALPQSGGVDERTVPEEERDHGRRYKLENTEEECTCYDSTRRKGIKVAHRYLNSLTHDAIP